LRLSNSLVRIIFNKRVVKSYTSMSTSIAAIYQERRTRQAQSVESALLGLMSSD